MSGLQFRLDLFVALALVPAAQRLAATATHLDLGTRLFQVLGHLLPFGGEWHAVGIRVAGAPATGTVGIFNVVGSDHQRQFHRVIGIHLAAIDTRDRIVFTLRPAEAHVEILTIIGCLDIDRDTAALAGDRVRLDLLTGRHLHPNLGRLLVVAIEAAVARLEGTRTAVVLAAQCPLHGALARIEQHYFTGRHVRPVDHGAASRGCCGCGCWRRCRSRLFSLLRFCCCFFGLFICLLFFYKGLPLGRQFTHCQCWIRLHHGIDLLFLKLVVDLLVGDTLVAIDTGVTCQHAIHVLLA